MNSNKWSIQISKEFHNILKKFCEIHGYKMGKFIEKSTISAISASIEK